MRISCCVLFWSFVLSFRLEAAPSKSSGLLNITRTATGRILLNGPDCTELQIQERFLRSWTEQRKEVPGSPEVSHKSEDLSSCSLDITDSVPKAVVALQNHKALINGPNCWNTALWMGGLIPWNRFSQDQEMTLWMNSPYCHELAESQTPTHGDIVAIRTLKAPAHVQEIHGMIYISEDLVFSKNTSGAASPYGIQRANLVYQTFRLTEPNCLGVHGIPQGCPRWSNVYRCLSPTEDQKNLALKDSDWSSYSKELSEIEAIISNYVLWGQGDYLEQKVLLSERLTLLEKKLSQISRADPKINFLYQTLLQTIHSLRIQLDLISQ